MTHSELKIYGYRILLFLTRKHWLSKREQLDCLSTDIICYKKDKGLFFPNRGVSQSPDGISLKEHNERSKKDKSNNRSFDLYSENSVGSYIFDSSIPSIYWAPMLAKKIIMKLNGFDKYQPCKFPGYGYYTPNPLEKVKNAKNISKYTTPEGGIFILNKGEEIYEDFRVELKK